MVRSMYVEKSWDRGDSKQRIRSATGRPATEAITTDNRTTKVEAGGKSRASEVTRVSKRVRVGRGVKEDRTRGDVAHGI